MCVLDSCGDGSLQRYNRLYPSYFLLLVCVPTLYCYVYKSSNVCLSKFFLRVVYFVISSSKFDLNFEL
jgi:hypothetical protein